MKTDVEALRKKYMDNPPEGLTSTDIRHMSEEDLLDMEHSPYERGRPAGYGLFSK